MTKKKLEDILPPTPKKDRVITLRVIADEGGVQIVEPTSEFTDREMLEIILGFLHGVASNILSDHVCEGSDCGVKTLAFSAEKAFWAIAEKHLSVPTKWNKQQK